MSRPALAVLCLGLGSLIPALTSALVQAIFGRPALHPGD